MSELDHYKIVAEHLVETGARNEVFHSFEQLSPNKAVFYLRMKEKRDIQQQKVESLEKEITELKKLDRTTLEMVLIAEPYIKENKALENKVKILTEGAEVLVESNGFYGKRKNWQHDSFASMGFSYRRMMQHDYDSFDDHNFYGGERAREAANSEKVKAMMEVIG